MHIFKLHLQAAIMRQRLEEMVDKYGTSDPRVLAMSQKLDRVLVQLQKEKRYTNDWVPVRFKPGAEFNLTTLADDEVVQAVPPYGWQVLRKARVAGG